MWGVFLILHLNFIIYVVLKIDSPIVLNFRLGITVNTKGLIYYNRGVISNNLKHSNYNSRGISCSNDYEPHSAILNRVTQWSQPKDWQWTIENYCSNVLGSLILLFLMI